MANEHVVEIPVWRRDGEVVLPQYAREGDAGIDLRATSAARLAPAGGRALVDTGLYVAIPVGYAGLVQPRSGLALKHGVTVLNSPGLIDSGYRDELRVLLINLDPTEPFVINVGDRIAQLVVQPVAHVVWDELASRDQLSVTDRGLGGFGSTGV
jgi:dUTP pyrophosphatase